MSRSSSKKSRTPIWVAIGAIFLIILLIIWLTFADLTGNTDVAAFLAPYIVNSPVAAIQHCSTYKTYDMDTLASIAPGHAGLLIWLVWALIGLFEGLVASRVLGGRRIAFMDVVVGIVSACIGGFLSINFVGSTAIMLFLISILAAIFASALVLWLVGTIFYKDSQEIDRQHCAEYNPGRCIMCLPGFGVFLCLHLATCV